MIEIILLVCLGLSVIGVILIIRDDKKKRKAWKDYCEQFNKYQE